MGKQSRLIVGQVKATQCSMDFATPNCGPPLSTAKAYLAYRPPIDAPAPLEGSASHDLRGGRKMLQKLLSFQGLQILSGSPQASMRLRHTKLLGMHFVLAEYSAPTSLKYCVEDSAILIDIALRGTATHRTTDRSHFIRDGEAFFHPPGNIHQRNVEAGYHSLLVQFPRRLLEGRVAHLLQRPIRCSLAFDAKLDLTTEGQCFWRLLNWLSREIDQPSSVLLQPKSIAAKIEKVLYDTLLYTHRSNYSVALSAREPIAIPRHLRSVISAIREVPERDWTLAAMAEHAKVSVRTVCEVFRSFHGCTPMEFLRSVRLARTHEELQRLDARTSVAAVAKRWGFGHAGRFAAAYTKAYGETPSDTLRGTKHADADIRPSA
ncbi:MAG TPA: AraC family transcriptional regulator [Alphaproteobacteria bacterium]|jgi:AraC-like DNA-binding protein